MDVESTFATDQDSIFIPQDVTVCSYLSKAATPLAGAKLSKKFHKLLAEGNSMNLISDQFNLSSC